MYVGVAHQLCSTQTEMTTTAAASKAGGAGSSSIRQRQQHKQRKEKEKQAAIPGAAGASTTSKPTGKRRVTKAVITNPFTLEWWAQLPGSC
jgi:protein involved in polysaccharide export with SLBB domain